MLRRKLPRPGAQRLAGVRLPPGRVAGDGLLLWVSDHTVADPFELARRLAAVYPRTGLWPLLWPHWDKAASYMDGESGLGGISHINVERFLASSWAQLRQGLGGFPGLAAATTARRDVNPFVILGRNQALLASSVPGPYQLLLIPARRPGDTISAVGYGIAGPTNGAYSAVARSWESRFGAYLVMLTPDGREVFAVTSPPRDPSQVRRLAAEILAVTPPQFKPYDALNALTQDLLGIPADPNTFDPGIDANPEVWAVELGDED